MVAGSIPAEPTKFQPQVPSKPSPEPKRFPSEDLNVREMLEVLLGTDGKRKMRLSRLTNTELFLLYESDLSLRHRRTDAMEEAKSALVHFKGVLFVP